VNAGTAQNAGVTVDAHDVAADIEIASPFARVADRKLKPALYPGFRR
jgi:hypothetical protein